MNTDLPPRAPRRCPRCDAALGGPGHPGACATCGGQWVEAEALRAIDPVMAQIALHTSEILQHETRYGGIARCPGCAAVPITFAFFEVLIDWCGRCGGVWFDGGELADLQASIASLRRAGGGNAVLHFRQQAAEAVTIGTVRCRGCRAVTPLRETWMGEDGALCNACGHQFYYGIVAPDAAALAQIEASTEGLGAGVLATLRRLLRA